MKTDNNENNPEEEKDNNEKEKSSNNIKITSYTDICDKHNLKHDTIETQLYKKLAEVFSIIGLILILLIFIILNYPILLVIIGLVLIVTTKVKFPENKIVKVSFNIGIIAVMIYVINVLYIINVLGLLILSCKGLKG